MPDVAITITEQEQIELEEVLLDRDQKAALDFLKRVVKAKVEHHIKAHCKPPL